MPTETVKPLLSEEPEWRRAFALIDRLAACQIVLAADFEAAHGASAHTAPPSPSQRARLLTIAAVWSTAALVVSLAIIAIGRLT